MLMCGNAWMGGRPRLRLSLRLRGGDCGLCGWMMARGQRLLELAVDRALWKGEREGVLCGVLERWG